MTRPGRSCRGPSTPHTHCLGHKWTETAVPTSTSDGGRPCQVPGLPGAGLGRTDHPRAQLPGRLGAAPASEPHSAPPLAETLQAKVRGQGCPRGWAPAQSRRAGTSPPRGPARGLGLGRNPAPGRPGLGLSLEAEPTLPEPRRLSKRGCLPGAPTLRPGSTGDPEGQAGPQGPLSPGDSPHSLEAGGEGPGP